MKSYDLQMEISGSTAMWTRPDTGSSPVSYVAPTFSANENHLSILAPFLPIIQTLHLTARIEQDKNGFYAHCPVFKGCHTQGETMEETCKNLQEATSLYLETLTAQEIKDCMNDQTGRAQ